ncbi:uncharacterized protein LOC120552646 isoform X5 [Xyrichtys novacula]|uniref:Uncharacterized protein LOC120552646 isoform X5 n=1 Tax=Xyrichtys novacula TaxID=13765 RepID=A0AAV1HHH8_XYRNO|nr:uncharacterized protein LOC120552646 isoform X5 [Xyrichtys novacula]
MKRSNLGGQKCTWQQVKIKYKNILTNATKKKARLGATGGGPPPEEFTQAESLTLSYNKGPKIDGIQGGSASSPIDPAIRATFVEVTEGQITLLEPPEVAAGPPGDPGEGPSHQYHQDRDEEETLFCRRHCTPRSDYPILNRKE